MRESADRGFRKLAAGHDQVLDVGLTVHEAQAEARVAHPAEGVEAAKEAKRDIEYTSRKIS